MPTTSNAMPTTPTSNATVCGLFVVLLLGLGAGCDGDGDGVWTATSEHKLAGGNTCPASGCPTNEVKVYGSVLSPFALGGETNADGWAYLGATGPDGAHAEIAVNTTGELTIVDTHGHVLFERDQLESTILHFREPSSQSVDIHIDEVNETLAYWVGPAETLTSYTMTWVLDGQITRKSICSDPPESDYDGAEADVVVFTHETWDANTGTVESTGSSLAQTLNFACVDTFLTKMLRYRHRPEAQPGDPYYTVPEERQALARMFRADYCGDGNRHTTSETPLYWLDDHAPPWIDKYSTATDPVHHEALWTSEGALCLDGYRRVYENPGIATSACSNKQSVSTHAPLR